VSPPWNATPPPRDPAAWSLTAPHADSIDNYKPKKPAGWLIVLAVVVAVAIVGAILLWAIPRNSGESPPATAPVSTPAPTPTRTGGTAFSNSNVSGYWKITKTTWTNQGVTLTVEITVDKGSLYYSFYAFANTDMTELEPTLAAPTDLAPGFVEAGRTLTGTLTFDVPRQPLTLMMQTTNLEQLTALPVTA
jgi:hypothetical protein